MSTWTVKQGDLAFPILQVVKDENGNVVDISGATVVFSMRNARSPGTAKINNAAAVLVDGPTGQIKYQWAGTDTDTPGTYEAEFRVTPVSGSAYRVPTDGYITVVVEPKVA